MRCPSCGHDNRADAGFCEECGEELRPSGQACPGCGAINSPDARFCVGCGSRLTGAEAPPVSAPPTTPEPPPRTIRMSALIRVLLSHTDILIEPGQRGELSVTVQNLSEIVDQYSVEVEGLDTAWYTVSPPNVSLFPQDRGEVKVSLHPSSGAKAGRYDFSVRVTSRENPIDWTRIRATLEVLPVSFFEMTLSPQRSSIVGAEAAFQVQLNNPGNVDLALSLSATDPEEGCTYLFQPQRVTVEAGRSRAVPLTVRPKDRPSEEARRYDFTVKAVPADAPRKAREVLGQLESRPLVISFEVGVSPETQSTQGRGTFSVQLTNLGNAEIALDLSATDPEAACSYRFRPQRVTLAAGGSGEVPLVVTPSRRPPPGETKSYDFTIKATPADAPQLAQTTTGRLEVLRPKRRWGLVAVAVGVPLLAVLASALCIWAWPGPAPAARVYPSTPTPTRRPDRPTPTPVYSPTPTRRPDQPTPTATERPPAIREGVTLVGGGWAWEHELVQDAILHAVDWWYLTEGTPHMDVAVTVKHVDGSGQETTVRDDARAVDYDPEYARQLLAEAGLPDGFYLRLLVSQHDEDDARAIDYSFYDMAQVMAEFLEEVGFYVDIWVVFEPRAQMNEAIDDMTSVLWLSWR